jgi:hypothetical protein
VPQAQSEGRHGTEISEVHHTQHPILQSLQRGKDSETNGDGAKAADEKVLPSWRSGAPDSPPKGAAELDVTNVIFIISVVLSKL